MDCDGGHILQVSPSASASRGRSVGGALQRLCERVTGELYILVLGVQTLSNPSTVHDYFYYSGSYRMSVGDPVFVCERGRGLSSPSPAIQLSGRCGSYQRGHDPGDSGDAETDGKYTTFTVYTHTVRPFSL